jgi:hypothetical protein
LIGGLLLTAVFGFAYWYLSSALLAARVAAKLAEMYGGRVTVGGASVGTKESTLRDVSFFEPDRPNRPWLTVDRIDTDLTLRGALQGKSPNHLELRGLTVLLRFDAQGKLLTQLPAHRPDQPNALGEVPEITVTGSKLFCVGPGRRQAAFEDVAGSFKPGLGRASISGHAVSPIYGGWTVDGWFDSAASTISLTATTDSELAVSQEMLERLPFLAPETWQQVQTHGDTTAAVTLVYDGAKNTLNYDVHLQTRAVDLRVAAIDLEGDDLSGQVRIADGQVWFQDVKGRLADGKIDIDGHLDLTQPALQLELTKATLEGVDARKLPASWSIPPQLTGSIDVAFKLTFSDGGGKIHISGTGSGEVREARLAGQPAAGPVKLALREAGAATFLDCQFHLPPSPMSALAAGFQSSLPPATEGLLELDAKASLPLDTIADARTYKGTGQGTLTAAKVLGLPLETLQLPLRIDEGDLHVDNAQGKLPEAGSFSASLVLNGSPPYNYRVDLGSIDLDLAVLEKLDPMLRPNFPVTGRLYGKAVLDGRIQPLLVNTVGSATLQNCEVGPIKAANLQGHWKGLWTPASDGHGPTLDIAADLTAPTMVSYGVHASDVSGAVRLEAGKFTGKMEGKTLGGTFEADAELDHVAQNVPGHPGTGKLRLHRIGLSRLAALGGGDGDYAIRGFADGEMAFQFDVDDFHPVGRGRITIGDLTWQDKLLTTRIQADVVLDPKELTVQDVSATIAQGTVLGRVVLPREPGRAGWFRIEIDGADAAQVLAPWPELAEHVAGSLEVRLRGTLGTEWSGSADLALQRGKILGVEVVEWRVPARWSLRPSDGQGQIEIRDSTAQVGQGRASAQASAMWDHGLTMTGQVQFVDVEMKQALSESKFGRGRATGRLDFGGDHMVGIDDLKATLDATMRSTQAFEIPLLRPVAPLLGLAPGTTFQSGEVKARLAKSVVHIEKLTMADGPLQLYADGNVTLQGRVDLELTANAGKLNNIAAMLGFRIPQTGFIGRDLLVKATTALSPRLMSMHIRGTLHEPRVEVVPLPILTEQALRFFAGALQ